MVDRITRAASRMHEMLEELLAVSRAGRVVNAPRPVPLKHVVREASEALAKEIEERGVAIDVAPDLPTVRADPTRLREVLQNLIGNAVRFMGDQPDPRIEISATRENGHTVCSVRDNGIGIAPEHFERVFGIFNRLNPSIEGTGVGLAVAKRVIEAHGGRMWIVSEGPGTGTTFRFSLPDVPPTSSQS
jgi:signal transduction histidine kinase